MCQGFFGLRQKTLNYELRIKMERWLQPAGPPDLSGFDHVSTFASNVGNQFTEEASVFTI